MADEATLVAMDLDALATLSDQDLDDAAEWWRRHAPPDLAGLVDADEYTAAA